MMITFIIQNHFVDTNELFKSEQTNQVSAFGVEQNIL